MLKVLLREQSKLWSQMKKKFNSSKISIKNKSKDLKKIRKIRKNPKNIWKKDEVQQKKIITSNLTHGGRNWDQ